MLAQLLDMTNETNCILPPGPLFYYHLQMALMMNTELRSTSPSNATMSGRVSETICVGDSYRGT